MDTSEDPPQSNLQSEIRAIQSDSSLDSREKSRRISEAMRQWNRKKAEHSRAIEVEEKATARQKTTPKACTHYKRGCDIQCPTCQAWYPCRQCHDAECDHKLDRHRINSIRCRTCNWIQQPSQHCVRCTSVLGTYYCNVCHLWSSGTNPIFHCNECGICRVGRKQDYTHCQKCNHCYATSFYETHKCVEDSTRMPCPVCNDYMFDGTLENKVAVLQCGHSIHVKCWESLLKHGNYRCPFCKKTVADGIKEQWRVYDMLSQYEPIPEEFEKKRLIILCNDCEEKSDVKFSFEFRKCGKCGGYNTNELDVYESETGEARDVGDNAVVVTERTQRIPPLESVLPDPPPDPLTALFGNGPRPLMVPARPTPVVSPAARTTVPTPSMTPIATGAHIPVSSLSSSASASLPSGGIFIATSHGRVVLHPSRPQ